MAKGTVTRDLIDFDSVFSELDRIEKIVEKWERVRIVTSELENLKRLGAPDVFVALKRVASVFRDEQDESLLGSVADVINEVLFRFGVRVDAGSTGQLIDVVASMRVAVFDPRWSPGLRSRCGKIGFKERYGISYYFFIPSKWSKDDVDYYFASPLWRYYIDERGQLVDAEAFISEALKQPEPDWAKKGCRNYTDYHVFFVSKRMVEALVRGLVPSMLDYHTIRDAVESDGSPLKYRSTLFTYFGNAREIEDVATLNPKPKRVRIIWKPVDCPQIWFVYTDGTAFYIHCWIFESMYLGPSIWRKVGQYYIIAHELTNSYVIRHLSSYNEFLDKLMKQGRLSEAELNEYAERIYHDVVEWLRQNAPRMFPLAVVTS